MRNYLLICAALFGMSFLGHAQVGVGTKAPSPSTILDIDAKNGDRGVLFPRVHLKDLNELDPVIGKKGDLKIKGLIVFNINASLEGKDLTGKSEGFYVWSGTSWDRLTTRSEILKLIGDNNNSQSLEDIWAVINQLINQTKPGEPLKGTSVVLYDFDKEQFYTLVKDEKGNVVSSEVINLTNVVQKAETKSLINRGEVIVDGQKPELVKSINYDQTKLKKGQIFYEYLGEEKDKEGKQIPFYLDITGDVKKAITNNQEVQQIFEETVNKFLTEGGNVFFGDHDDDNSTDEVLYTFVMNPTTGKREKKIINLAETIREIFKHEVVTTEIREALGYNITEKAVSTGNKVNGKMIYIYSGLTSVEDFNAETSGVALPAEYNSKAIDVFEIQLYNKMGYLEKTGITDVEVKGGKIDFSLGSGGLYTSLPKGDYKVVVQFVVK